MSAIRYEVNQNSLKIINTLSPNESPDVGMIETVNSGAVRGILPVNLNRNGYIFSLECSISMLFPLSQILSAPISKLMFTDILQKTVSVKDYHRITMPKIKNRQLHTVCFWVHSETSPDIVL